jgi:hypothetical protein
MLTRKRLLLGRTTWNGSWRKVLAKSFALAAFVTALLFLVAFVDAAPPDFSWLPPAPELPPPEGQVIRVSTVDQLFQAARDVQPGETILVADGHYMMPRYFELRTDNVTLRGETGDRNKVILDGAESMHGELVGVRACSGVTFADLTIQNIRHNGFKINSNFGVHRVTIHNCMIHNIWQRGVKGVRVPEDRPEIQPPQDCRIQHCLFYNDRPKRFEDDLTDTPETFNGNYVGGIDVMYADGWTISDNLFYGIQGRTGEARGAVFLWHDAKDCIVQWNVIVDCVYPQRVERFIARHLINVSKRVEHLVRHLRIGRHQNPRQVREGKAFLLLGPCQFSFRFKAVAERRQEPQQQGEFDLFKDV